MRSSAIVPRKSWFAILALILMMGLTATQAYAQPTLSKVFTPNTIGPGSVSTITFTITNGNEAPVTDLAFTDVLPAAITIADPANASTDCDLGISGSLSAPDGGTTITLSDAQIGGVESCTITVNVTASTPGVHTNPAVTLTSSAGTSMSSPVDLTVVTTLPGFSKSFAPSSVPLGGRSTLTFTIDNSLNPARVGNLDFTDNLPTGLVIADPPNASTDCVSASLPATDLIADAGTSVIILAADGNTILPGFEVLPIGATCTVTVDVVATGIGSLTNVTGDLLADFTSAGKATDELEVTITPIALTKMFTDDPTPPGNTVTLEFTIDNLDRFDAATGVGFTDDLSAILPGTPDITFDSLLSNDCGGTVAGVGTSMITFSGGTVAAESSCTIRVRLSVPAGATPGQYTNTTGAISATVGGSPVTGNMASDDIFVEPVPILTKEFLEVGTLAPDPVVNPGDDVVIRFTITNTSATSGATDVAFDDELTDGSASFPPDPTTGFLPVPVTIVSPSLPAAACGGTLALYSPNNDAERQGLRLTGGTLAEAGMSGDACTIDVTVTIPADFEPGIYTNTTEEITATVDGATRIGEPASDDLTVIAAPSLTKEFTDDPVAPGGTVTLQFTLEYSPNAPGDATAITFTDDLTALVPPLAGLTASGLPLMEACDPDGVGGDPGTGTLSESSGVLTFMGGTLSPGEICTFSVTLDVPAGAAPGTYTNTTSGVSATVEGLTATSAAASDDFKVSGLIFTKEFLDNPVIAGGTTTLRFTIQNVHPTEDATITFFTDNLQLELTGLAATGPPSLDECGGSLSGTTFLIYTGGSVMSGETCNIEVEVLVPLGAADGTYTNITSSLTASQGGAVIVDPAQDELIVNNTLLELTKEFTDDPVNPGDPVTLEFTLTNLDGTNAASMIDFTDNLGAALTDLTFDSVLLNDCGATITGTGTTTITVDDAALAAGASCTIRVSLTVPAAAEGGIYTNTTSDVSGTINSLTVRGDPASDDLEVTEISLDFSKSFDGPTTAGGTAVLTFTITNAGTEEASILAFSDDLDAVITGLDATGLPQDDVCGEGSQIATDGAGLLTLTGGTLPPMGGTCVITVTVSVPVGAAPGVFTNTTSDLFLNGASVAQPATADLTIEGVLDFSKDFAPDPIGPGSVTMLTFTITNPEATGVTDLAFTDDLPDGMTIAAPAAIVNECGGTVTAPDGGTIIELTGGLLAAGDTCTITVNVTAGLIDTSDTNYSNTTSVLSSSLGTSDPATDDLDVVKSLPGFTKSFAPSSVGFGGRSTLTLTIDNSNNASDLTNLDFTDNLPDGMEIADPANASTDCGTATVPPTLTADAGDTVIILDANGNFSFPALDAGATCTVTVDVEGNALGQLGNVTNELLVVITATQMSAGKASAVLEVSGGAPDGISLVKEFIDDPTPPGDEVTLQFTILNGSRDFSATDIAFDDDLETMLTGLAPNETLPKTVCNGGTLDFATGTLSLTGGTLAAEGTCTFTVTLLVPAGTTPGEYINTTTAVTGMVNGSPVTGNMATDDLFVEPVPRITKTFLDNPVGGGGTTRLEFTITNTSTTSAATDIAFEDVFNEIMPTASAVPADGSCGASSDFTFTALTNPPPPASSTPATLTLTDGEVAAGASCTFEITLDVDPGAAPGTYTNTTSAITATVDGATRMGDPASDDVVIVAAPALVKEFTDDPVDPGATVTLEFTLTNDDPDNAASDIAFTDDLDAVISGLVATGLPQSECGGTVSTPDGGMTIEFTGGSLAAGASCTFSVTLDVPGTATPGSHTNTTSAITATVLSTTATGNAASDDLEISSLTLTKEFTDDPILPGGTGTLRFTLDNASATDATGIDFDDALSAILPGTPDITVVTALPISVCGGTLSGTASFLSFDGGSVLANDQCSFDVTIMVPAGTADDTYTNVTSSVTSSLGTGDPATDELIVMGTQLELTKEFTDDPIEPGGTGTLRFTLTNLDPTNTASAVAFDDDLDAALSGLVATGLPVSGCGGTADTSDGGMTIEFTGGTLTGGEVCFFDVTVTVPGGAAEGSYTNTTTGVTGTINGLAVTGDPATDELTVSATIVTFSKSFDGPTTATGTPVLSFTITNTASTSVSDLGFTDILEDVISGLVSTSGTLTDVCGSGSMIEGTSTLMFTGGNLGPSESCTIDVDLLVPDLTAAGTYPNTTSELSQNGIPVADPATADLTVEPAPTFAKEFDPDAILFEGASTLTFTIDNTASALDATDLDFTDNLPAGVVIADPANATTDCTGGTLTADAGTSVITYTGGEVAAGASCTISVDVTGTAGGTHTNLTEDLTSSSGNSGTATDDLEVEAEPDITVEKTDDGDSEPGNTIVYTVTITNNGGGATDVVFTDTVDGNTTLDCTTNPPATTLGTVDTCDDSTGEVTVDVGTLAAGGSVTITFEVTVDDPLPAGVEEVCNQGTASGSNFDDVDSDDPDTAAADDETCVTIDAAPDLALSKDDGDATVMPGNDVSYDLTVDNNGNQDATGVEITETVPDNTTYSASNTDAWSCSAGDPAGTDCTLAIGDLAGGSSATATFIVTVDNPVPAGVEEVENEASVEDDGTNGADPNPDDNDASDTTPIDAMPEVTAEKTAELIDDDNGDGIANPGDKIKYTIVITNNGDEDATDVLFTDEATDHPNTTLVDGSVTTTQGTVDSGNGGGPDTDVEVSLGMIAGGGGTATITFEVTVDDPLPPSTEEVCNQGLLTDNFPDTPTDDPDQPGASDETCIDAAADPIITVEKTDDGDAEPGDVIVYTVTITNTGGAATDVVFTDTVDGNTTLDCTTNPPATTLGTIDTCDDSTGEVTVDVGTLAAAGGSVTITFEVTVDDPLPAGVEEVCNQGTASGSNFDDVDSDDPDTGDAGDTTCSSVEATPDLALSKDDGGITAMPGDDVPYTLTVDNNGNQDATGVEITETVPDNTTYSASNTDAWSCSAGDPAGTDCTLAIGDLAGGSSATATFIVTVDNPVPAGVEEVENEASVEDDGTNGADPNPDDNDASDTTPVDASPEVDATKTDALVVDVNGNGLFDPGDTIEYTIVVSNTGNEGADTVVFTDTPGANTTLVVGSVVAPDGTIVEGNTAGDTMVEVHYDEIDGDPLAPTSATITFRVLIVSPFPNDAESVENQGVIEFVDGALVAATILTDDPDTPALDDPTVTPINLTADLALTKRVDNPTPERFTPVEFTLTLENGGPVASGAVVLDLLPEGLLFVSADPAEEYEADSGTWKTEQIAVGDSTILLIVALVEAHTPVTNEAEIIDTEFPDPNEDNNTASVTITPTFAANAKESEMGMTLQEAEVEIPEEFELGPNYPNPFNPETVIPVGIPEASDVTVMVYDILGRHVTTLYDGTLAPGWYNMTWRATNQPTGVYFVRMQAGSFVKTQRVTLLK